MSALEYDQTDDDEVREMVLDTPSLSADEYELNLQDDEAVDEAPSLGATLPNGDPPSWMLWGVDDE